MSNERIDLTKELEWLHEPRGDRSVGTISKHDVVVESDYIEGLIAELKRCYKLLDDADYAMSRYGDEEEHQDIDNVCDAYEAVCNALAGQGR